MAHRVGYRKEDNHMSKKINADIVRKYLVIMDGDYPDKYGAELYFVGLFSTREEAENGIAECVRYADSIPEIKERGVTKDWYKILEVDEGWYHYPHLGDHGIITTDMCIGGYIE